MLRVRVDEHIGVSLDVSFNRHEGRNILFHIDMTFELAHIPQEREDMTAV